MIELEDYRTDKEFKIDSLTYQEIFESLKDGIEKVICEFEKVPPLQGLELREDKCSTRFEYGKDKDMYPTINLEVRSYSSKFWSNYNVMIINPFEIDIRCIGEMTGRVHILTSENLTQALIDMINEKFPNSDYMEKREKYFKMAELMQRKREEMLFF